MATINNDNTKNTTSNNIFVRLWKGLFTEPATKREFWFLLSGLIGGFTFGGIAFFLGWHFIAFVMFIFS